MRKNILKGVAFFLVGFMITQVVTGESKKAAAASFKTSEAYGYNSGGICETKSGYEVKEISRSNNSYDTLPKTSDESYVLIAYKLICASLFTMILLYLVSLINKRKQKF